MNQKSARHRITLITSIIIIACTLIFSAIYIPLSLKQSDAWTTDNKTDANRVLVGELYAKSGGGAAALDAANIMKLNQYLFGKNHTPATLSSNIHATTIRKSTKGGKTATQSVIVTLGGREWTVMYVSKTKSGDLIASLWLAENTSTSTFGNSTSYIGSNSATQTYPTNMYGTSYLRAVGLNNGGSYVNVRNTTSLSLTSTNGGVPSTTHEFAPFTVANPSTYPGLTNYIVKPVDVAWQENGEDIINIMGWGNNLSNENWSDEKMGATADERYFDSGGYFNWAGKSGNSTWKNDNLWIPSVTEVGDGGASAGMWKTNQNERSNSAISWLRSANHNNSLYLCGLNPDGSFYSANGVNDSRTIRPALHLNLTKLSADASKYSVAITSENTALGTVGGASPYSALNGEKYYVSSNTLQMGDTKYTATPKTGHSFVGWYNGSTKLTQTSAAPGLVGANMSIVAKFKVNTYTVAYNGNGATSGSTANSSHTYGVAKTLTSNGFVRTGYSFLGWNTDKAATTAKYTNGQSVSNLTTANAATVTLYAIWKANTYTVTLDRQSGAGGTTSVTATFGANMPAATMPTRTGYTFGGYYTAANGGGTQYYSASGASARTWNLTSNKTLYAKWTANTYTVTFDRQSGTGGSGSVTATFDSVMPTATMPTRTGYIFGGYYSAENGGGTQYYTSAGASAHIWDKASNTTLYAKWTAITYTIVYNGNGADAGTMENSSHTYDVAKQLSKNMYAKLNCVCLGWSTDKTAPTPQYANEASVLNLTTTNGATVTLYAVWQLRYSLDISVSIAGAGEVMILYNSAVTTEDSFQNGSKLVLVAVPNNRFAFVGWEVEGLSLTPEQLTNNKLELVLTNNTKVTVLFADSVANGVFVTSTKGGIAYIVGDDFESLDDDDFVTICAKQALGGYTFSHWVDAGGNIWGTIDSLKLKKSEVMNNLLTAVFVPVDKSDVNGDTGN